MMGLSTGLGSAEMELQKMLIDERMKSTNHGINYQTLKAEHQSVQDEFTQSQGKLRQLLSDRQAEQENVKLLLAELRGEMMDQTRELEELRLQVMTPQRLELIIAQVQQEMEAPVRERFKKLEEETEKYKFDLIKLRYDYTFVMSQFEHQREEHARILEERRIHFDAELSRLEKDRKDQVAQNQGADTLHDGEQVEALLREKAQLHQRLEELEAEVGDLRAQKENYGQQAENVQHIQIQQLSESQTTLKSMEAERQSLHLKLERRGSEVYSLTSEIQSLKYSHKLEMDGVKLEWNHSKGEMERERDALQVQSDGLQADAEVLKALVERHKDVLVEKEREMAGRVQAACEEDFRKTATLHKEKLELENRLAALQQQRALQDTADHVQKEEWKQRVCSSQQGEESVRREVKNLRSRIQQQMSQLKELETQKTEIADLQQQNQALGVRLATLSRSESDSMEKNQRLREKMDRLREELKTTRGQAEKSQHEAERMLEDRQVEWLEEKHKLQQRESELQHKHSRGKEKMQRAAAAQKKRKTLTENKEKRLRDKIQLLQAQKEDLQLETAAAKKHSSFSVEEAQLSKRLKELQHRHNEFQHILLGTEGPLADIPDCNQRDLSLLRRRLQDLESTQRLQLKELGSVAQTNLDPKPQPEL